MKNIFYNVIQSLKTKIAQEIKVPENSFAEECFLMCDECYHYFVAHAFRYFGSPKRPRHVTHRLRFHIGDDRPENSQLSPTLSPLSLTGFSLTTTSFYTVSQNLYQNNVAHFLDSLLFIWNVFKLISTSMLFAPFYITCEFWYHWKKGRYLHKAFLSSLSTSTFFVISLFFKGKINVLRFLKSFFILWGRENEKALFPKTTPTSFVNTLFLVPPTF